MACKDQLVDKVVACKDQLVDKEQLASKGLCAVGLLQLFG